MNTQTILMWKKIRRFLHLGMENANGSGKSTPRPTDHNYKIIIWSRYEIILISYIEMINKKNNDKKKKTMVKR